MSDPRIIRHARLLVRYCAAARPGQTVAVAGTSAAEPLILAVYEELLRAGAFPVLTMSPAGAQEAFFRLARRRHLTELAPYHRAYARCVDVTISIRSAVNTRSLSGVDPRKQAALKRLMQPVQATLARKRWVTTLHPTAAYARDAGMGLKKFEDFVYGAMLLDRRDPVAAWEAVRRRQQRIIARLSGADEIRVAGPGTDLRFSVRRRRFINSDGRRNMPSGEVFTGPVEDSAEGAIEFDFPVCHEGREIEGVRLVFRRGVVVEASAAKNEAFLKAMLRTDRGARRLGEFGIGTNWRIQRFTRNILIDEKIGGTIHVALGQSYAETGGVNRSAIHWDLIKDLRGGGMLYVNGKAFQKKGRLVA